MTSSEKIDLLNRVKSVVELIPDTLWMGVEGGGVRSEMQPACILGHVKTRLESDYDAFFNIARQALGIHWININNRESEAFPQPTFKARSLAGIDACIAKLKTNG